MALDITLQGIKIKETYIKEVNTDTVRIKGIYFDFDNTEATSIVAFANKSGEVFAEKKQENWKLSGAYYQTQIMAVTSGNPIAEELLTKVASIVSTIHADATLKTQLLDSAELVIT